MEILIFVFFLLVFIGMLVGGTVIRKIKQVHKAVQQAADKREQQFRDEVGRKRQQYSQRAQPQSNQNAQSSQNSQNTQSNQSSKQQTARHTQTATGETIIDHHHEKRENRKIFDDSDGEYVEFEEA